MRSESGGASTGPVQFPNPCLTAVLAAILLLVASCPGFAAAAKVEDAGPLKEAAASEALRKVLQPTGQKVFLPDGNEYCDIWLRMAVASAGNREVEGAVFPQFSESELLGVITFPKSTTDFRGQPLAAGTYTMRYALLPNDGNHMGVAPSRDFVLLVPVATDSDPDAKLTPDALNGLSRKASGTKHPAPFDLVQPEGDITKVSAYQNGDGFWVFAAPLKAQSGESIPVGLVIKGQAQ